ncbi:hypothetical protein PCC7424_5789 (plasmid) [Gloeothece citriformis PCC 7424]|uniref:O-antigen polymerase n=1 Tax=Gloeothece citriformis (strain PCC 7424) TaxID=65393 RepID=B7KM30_GLOC7|nr:hypothetical protein [Gloeothece citriformis]ACK73852.1 hypothetical protein PCC7424_5789 [Gloeothece citriformis PCC 7424]
MAEAYRDILILICLGLLGWGLIRIERIYQYPFFMACIFFSFVVPQAVALVNNPGGVTQQALERVLLASCLCAAACWIGYERKPNPRWLAKLNIIVDDHKLFRAGIVLMVMGHFFYFLLSRTTIQRSAINGNWTGPATIYIFFSQVVNVAFTIFLLKTLKRPKLNNLMCTVISGWPLFQSILGGRRQPTMTFIIIVGLSLWIILRYLPPRWVIIVSIILLIFIIPVLGFLRGRFWDLIFSGQWQEIVYQTQLAFESQQAGEILELRNAALFMDAAEKTGLYGYGTGYWDSIIFQYVPGQIVGYDLKESLQFNLIKPETLENLYGYVIPTGSTTTGVGDSFIEFGYLGCLCFALIGYLFKNLWVSAVYNRSIISSLLYAGLVSPAMVGITHGIGRFLQEGIFQVVFVSLVAYYSKARTKPYLIESNPNGHGG